MSELREYVWHALSSVLRGCSYHDHDEGEHAQHLLDWCPPFAEWLETGVAMERLLREYPLVPIEIERRVSDGVYVVDAGPDRVGEGHTLAEAAEMARQS